MTARGDLSNLLSGVDIGPVSLRNRLVSTSHQTGLVHDHLPTDDLLAYHEARARGGVGAIFLEATAVDDGGLLTTHTIGGFLPELVSVYQRLSQTLHDHGTRLFVQLNHGGREQISGAPRPPTGAPSAVPSLRFKCEPRALTLREISALIDGYAICARHAQQGGLDGIEVSVSHGYLPAQFLSPASNRRADRYGGTALAARLRFTLEALGAVRDAAGPTLAVGVRLSADELAPAGLDLRAGGEIAAALQESGLVDFISLVLGHSAFPSASTWIAPPPPALANAIAQPAAAIRAAVPDANLLATTRVVDLLDAEALIASGTADLVGMTRALIADPELLAKSVAGRRSEVIECVGCNQSCIGHYHAGLPIGCAVNPRTGRERSMPAPGRAPGSGRPGGAGGRRVLVIGAGPAGAAAALQAALAGDSVTVLEREAEIGGQLRIAGLAPAHRELWDRYRRSTSARLRAAGVTLELSTPADAGRAEDFDLVVLATGARPYEPLLPSPTVPVIRSAWAAIVTPSALTAPVLVADWGGGWDGLDAAERVAVAGLAVTLACAAPVPGETLHQYQRHLYLARLDRLGVPLLHHTELAIETGQIGLRHVFSGRALPMPALQTLVLAQGRVPDDRLWAELETHPGAIRAGDVLGPRTLEEAVLEGTQAVCARPTGAGHTGESARTQRISRR
jgi:2,4-dienoyl-CoA reductase-like NADH-dependent reductase (Old Yellow Enzyme family)